MLPEPVTALFFGPNDGEEYRAFRTVRKGPVQGCANGATTAPVGSGVACSGALRLALVAGTVLCLADWVLVEDLGFLGGIGTDPNSMVPMSLLSGAGYLAITRALPTAAGALTTRAPFPARS